MDPNEVKISILYSQYISIFSKTKFFLQFFDQFKNNAKISTNQYYLTTKQMRYANAAGQKPSLYIQGFKSYDECQIFMEKCETILQGKTIITISFRHANHYFNFLFQILLFVH